MKNYKQKSNMKHSFSNVPQVKTPRSVFNRSHTYKTTFDAGYLIPFYVDEALPGDTFNLRATLFGRLNTPLTPVMDNMRLDTFYFAVPVRLLWDNWQKFMGEQASPGDSTDYLVPQMSSPEGGFVIGSLSDYFGIPTAVENLDVNSLWHRAYNLIYNEWFRDQNLQASVVVDTDDGPDDPDDYVLLKRGKRHDYFTSCLPWPQKGTAVDLPLGTSAPVTYIPYADRDASNLFGMSVLSAIDDHNYRSDYAESKGLRVEDGDLTNNNRVETTPNSPWFLDPTGYYEADLSSATAATINSLREAFQLQKMFERDARGGTRYTELIKSHFGVTSPDARLQRPEYLGGSTADVNFYPVANTSYSSPPPALAGSAKIVGDLSAFGTVIDRGRGFSKSFTEHCVIIGLACVTADLTYQTGLQKMFSRRTRYDYYWPSLAHLGEQAVLNKEIFAQGNADDDKVFGYQERYAEYRYYPSKITGLLRSSATQSLDYWHLSQDFGSTLPVLNSSFIEENPPIDRVVTVQSQPDFILDCFIDNKTVRPMPVYSVPGLIDHF